MLASMMQIGSLEKHFSAIYSCMSGPIQKKEIKTSVFDALNVKISLK